MKKNIIILGIGILIGLLIYVIFPNKIQNPNSVIGDKFDVENTSKDDVENILKSNSSSLDLSGQGLDRIPEYVLGMSSLKELNLSRNNLEGALPSQIAQLKNLEKLDVSDNKMTGIPAEIGQLEKLEELNYANNEITGLPLELGNLKNLKEIDLSGNDYSEYDMGIIKKELPDLVIKSEKEVVERKTEPPVVEKQMEVKKEMEEVVVTCNTGSFDNQFLCILNEYRKQNGKSVLLYNTKLNTVALNHSTWMDTNNEFSHTGDGGSSFSERCNNSGATCDAENLAFGAKTAQQLFNMWKDSPAHNKNMLGDHTELGIGIEGSYITVVFY